MSVTGYVHSFETLGALDGPGMRCVVFLQGCPLRCAYCHNPDTWDFKKGELMDVSAVVRRILKSAPYFSHGGGVTLSGGEPFTQAKFAAEILKACKAQDIHTAVDTCGYYLNDDVRNALEYTDLVILDIKHADAKKHRELTGRDLTGTLKFLDYVTGKKIPLWIRQVIVGGYNDTETDIQKLADLLSGYDLSNLKKIELLGYHTMAENKWAQLGLEYKLSDACPPNLARLRELQDKITSTMTQAGCRLADK